MTGYIARAFEYLSRALSGNSREQGEVAPYNPVFEQASGKLYQALELIPQRQEDIKLIQSGFKKGRYMSTVGTRHGTKDNFGPFGRKRMFERCVQHLYETSNIIELVKEGWEVEFSNRFWFGSYFKVRDPDGDLRLEVNSMIGWTPLSFLHNLFFGQRLYSKFYSKVDGAVRRTLEQIVNPSVPELAYSRA